MDQNHRQLTIRVPRFTRTGKIALYTGLAIIFIITFLVWHMQKSQAPQRAQPKSPLIFSAEIKQQAGFPLYQPNKLPEGFSVDAASVRLSESVITFSISTKESKHLVVSEQAIPKNFDFQQFYKTNVELPQQSDTPNGKLTTGKFNGLPVCMLVTSTTWIIINNTGNTSPDQLKSICKGFEKAH